MDATVTETWLKKHRLLYDSATRHPFILSIRDGSVDFSSFKKWLGQDYIFVRSFVPFVASTLIKSCKEHNDESDMEVILGGMASLNDEINWFKKAASNFHVSLTSVIPQNANVKYCSFLESLTSSEVEYPVAISVFWAIEAVYQESFAHCLEDGNRIPQELQETCERWGNEGFGSYCKFLRDIADRCLQQVSPDVIAKAEDFDIWTEDESVKSKYIQTCACFLKETQRSTLMDSWQLLLQLELPLPRPRLSFTFLIGLVFDSSEDFVVIGDWELTAELVPDIFEDILVRLDVKDLLRCKSVCKSWNSLITSPRFIKIHLKYSYNNDRNNNEIGHRRMVMSRHPNNCNFEVDVTFLYENETRKVIGSSNGLVCISDYDNHILVVNPSTREVNKVQKPSIPDSWTLCWGFGYDSSTYDYKVIVGFRKGSNLTCFQVLSLKSNEWKVIGDVNYSFTNRNIAVFCNGALHWAMHHDAKPYIICFDLSNEELKEIPQPDNSLYKPTRHCYMGIIEECLCLFRLVSFPYDIWVMKNYNLMESWERMPYDYKWKPEVAHNFKELRIYIPHFKPLCHGDLLLCRGPGFIFAPMFVQSLVTLHVNGKPNKKRQAKNDRMSCKLIKGDPSASEPSAEALLIMLKYSR